MNISMNGQYEDNSLESEYGEEVMFAGWNPDVSLLMCQQSRVLAEEQSMPVDLAMEDAGLFLQKMYANQS